eukprot:gnl/Dysnectes_brevis/2672_a3234_835.p1 GENE.gnl/Dysnectes_brevis/2672_a3234_835~~gnl/Dysnectes_brevis/2672_a3234_835.p1  ORF type:complete len:304 (+),score=89.42 gnl/Dysnectes_brevis/2672_a3234_835:151-1062(+)
MSSSLSSITTRDTQQKGLMKAPPISFSATASQGITTLTQTTSFNRRDSTKDTSTHDSPRYRKHRHFGSPVNSSSMPSRFSPRSHTHQSQHIQGHSTPTGSLDRKTRDPRFKTELCNQWLEQGYCQYGDRCRYAHGREQLRTTSQKQPRSKTPCMQFVRTGYCPFGRRCRFSHAIGGGYSGGSGCTTLDTADMGSNEAFACKLRVTAKAEQDAACATGVQEDSRSVFSTAHSPIIGQLSLGCGSVGSMGSMGSRIAASLISEISSSWVPSDSHDPDRSSTESSSPSEDKASWPSHVDLWTGLKN